MVRDDRRVDTDSALRGALSDHDVQSAARAVCRAGDVLDQVASIKDSWNQIDSGAEWLVSSSSHYKTGLAVNKCFKPPLTGMAVNKCLKPQLTGC